MTLETRRVAADLDAIFAAAKGLLTAYGTRGVSYRLVLRAPDVVADLLFFDPDRVRDWGSGWRLYDMPVSFSRFVPKTRALVIAERCALRAVR